MLLVSIATPTLILSIAAAVGLALLIVLFLRQTKTIEELRRDLGRMHKVQRDGSTDVRKRLDDNASTLIALQGAVEPLRASADQAVPIADALEGVKTGIVDLGAKIGTFEDRLGRIELSGQSAAAGVTSVRDDWSRIQAMIENTERNLASFEAGRTQEARRIEDLREAVTSLRGRVDDRIEVQERRLISLEGHGPKTHRKGGRASPGTATPAQAPGPTGAEPESPPAPTSLGGLARVAGLGAAGTSPGNPPPESAHPQTMPEPRGTGGAVTDGAAAAADDGEDASGANWIFLVLALLLGLALVAQYVRST